jgi:hypothetical protein
MYRLTQNAPPYRSYGVLWLPSHPPEPLAERTCFSQAGDQRKLKGEETARVQLGSVQGAVESEGVGKRRKKRSEKYNIMPT